MKAVGYYQNGPIDRTGALVDLEMVVPTPGGHDLLVEVSAISVNPIDTKIRSRRPAPAGRAEILGWDAVGTVAATGDQVTGFVPGDRVYYAGALNRPGANSQFHLVDHRIVGHAPTSLDDAQSAALPLTSITAWELLLDRLAVPEGGGDGQVLLIVGAAGGVGSILVQLARCLTGLTVVGTASRPESQRWVRDLGAHHVINPHEPWLEQLRAVGVPDVQWQACLTHTGEHWPQVVAVAAAQGAIGVIDDPVPALDVSLLKAKSLSLHWESMFTRSTFATADMAAQGALLDRVSQLVDAGRVRTTLARSVTPINASNLIAAHRVLEGGRSIGKHVLVGW